MLLDFLPERAPLCQLAASSRRLAQRHVAACAEDDALGMTEHGCDDMAARATDIHEETVRGLDDPLVLVLFGFDFWVGVQKISGTGVRGGHCRQKNVCLLRSARACYSQQVRPLVCPRWDT